LTHCVGTTIGAGAVLDFASALGAEGAAGDASADAVASGVAGGVAGAPPQAARESPNDQNTRFMGRGF
jgi:hypothetical protein